MKYAHWYDNGSGYFDANAEKETLEFDNYPYRQVATAGWDKDPNQSETHILAESKPPKIRTYAT